MGEQHFSFPRATVTLELWGTLIVHHLDAEIWGKKGHFFNIFLLLLPDAQCHFQLQASVSVVTCSGATCCDPMGQAPCTEDARITWQTCGAMLGKGVLVDETSVKGLQASPSAGDEAEL